MESYLVQGQTTCFQTIFLVTMFRKISRAFCVFFNLLGLVSHNSCKISSDTVYQHTDNMNVLGTSWWFAQISHLMISTIITFWHVVCINSFQIFSDKITQDNKKNLSECFLGAKSVFSPYFEMTIYPEKTSASPLKLSVFFSDDISGFTWMCLVSAFC